MPIVTTSSRQRPRRSAALPLAAVGVLAAAVAAWLLLREGPASSGPPQAESRPPEVGSQQPAADDGPSAQQRPSQPSPAPQESPEPATASPSPAEARNVPSPPAPGGALSDRPDAIRDLPGHITLPDGNVMTFPPPEAGKTISVSAQGRVYLADSVGNFVDATPPPVFDNPIEEQMVGISTPGGHFIPGLFLANSPAAITNMLYKDVVINEDDPADVQAKKEAVAETKQLMLSYLDAGYSLPEVVMAIAALADQERSLRRKGVSTIMRMVREGDVEGARKYKETLDDVIAEQQFSPIVLPKRVSEALYGGQPPAAN